jgi:polysaccharide export outer membrane protein
MKIHSKRWPYHLLAAAGLCLLAAAAAAQAPNPLRLLHFGSSAKPPAERLAPADPAGYVIGPADVLSINVWKEKDLSQTLPVRPDGRISLPLAGTVRASGRTPHQLEARIKSRLAPFVTRPVVTVMVVKVGSRSFSVLGHVLRPGTYPLLGPVRVLAALAQAGGFTPFANPGKIELLRVNADGSVVRFPFDYSAVIQGRHLNQDREMLPGDTLIVP